MNDVLVYWGEELLWDERRPVKKPKSDPVRLLMRGVEALTQAAKQAKANKVREHLVGVVRKSPQVVVKITGGGADMKRIGSHIDYIARGGRYKKKGQEELELETEEGLPVQGAEARAMLKEQWQLAGTPIPSEAVSFIGRDGKEHKPRREALNIIFSMPAGVNRDAVKAAARATAKELFGQNYQYVMAHHNDTDSQHAHVAVKMQGLDGKRLNPRKADLDRWRQVFAKKLNERGVEALATRRRTRLQRPKGESQAVRQMKDRGVAPDRIKSAVSQPLAVARALENEKRVVNAYTHITQALSTSPDANDRALAKNVRTALMAKGVSISLKPDKPRL